MKGQKLLMAVVGSVGVLFGDFDVDVVEAQTTNSWISVGAGNWQTSSDWSLGRIPTNTDSVFITNAITKAVFINSGTTNTASMTITNLTLSAPAGATNEVQLTNPGTNVPFRILNAFTITTGGSLMISDAVVRVEGPTATPFKDDGNVVLVSASSQLIMTNAVINSVAQTARGTLTLSNGTVLAQQLFVGNGSGAKGTLTVAGGLCQLSGSLTMGASAGATGTVWVTGGRLVLASSISSRIGVTGVGLMVVSNGSVEAMNLIVGTSARGTLALRGGTNIVSSSFTVAGGVGTGEVFITGGQLLTTNAGQSTLIGTIGGVGQVTMSDGTWLARRIVLGDDTGSQGTLAMVGGTNVLLSSLSIGEETNATGLVTFGGAGRLVVTNAPTFIGARGAGQMTISGGVFLASSVQLGTNVTANGTLTVNGGTAALIGPLTVGVAGTGNVSVLSGQLVITNTPATVGAGSGFIVDGSVTLTNRSSINVGNLSTVIGNAGSGSLTVFGGSMLASNIVVGKLAGSVGTLTIRGGTITDRGSLTAGEQLGSTGVVWITGGTVTVTNGPTMRLLIGQGGKGQMVVSNGTVVGFQGEIGRIGFSSGTLTIAGGTNLMTGSYSMAVNGGSTGTLWVTSGMLALTNSGKSAFLSAAAGGIANVTVSNGLLLADRLNLASGAGATGSGTLTSVGGTTIINTNLTIGTFDCGGDGFVYIAGGSLFVTNAAGNATLEVRSGTFTLSSGTVVVDKFAMTNACAHFVRTGGTLIYGSAVLNPNLSAVGDGIPNGWKQQYGLDPFDPNVGSQDPDGDGCNNLCEFLAGSNPVADIKAITKEGIDIRVTWQAAATKTNALQRSPGVNGSYSNNFADIFTVTNTVGTVTNYLDLGGATNSPSHYYRIRLVP